MRCTCVIALSVSIASGVLLGVPTVQAEKGAQPEKKDEIEVGPILVVGDPPKSLGTGTLHLDQESSSASRLGLTLREISATVGTSVVSRAGNRPQNIPQLVWNLWSVYRLEASVPMDVGAAFRFVGDRYGDNANSIQLHSYETVDA